MRTNFDFLLAENQFEPFAGAAVLAKLVCNDCGLAVNYKQSGYAEEHPHPLEIMAGINELVITAGQAELGEILRG